MSIFISAGEEDFREKLDLAKRFSVGLELLHFTSYENLYNRKKINGLVRETRDVPVVIHAPYEVVSFSTDRIVRKFVMANCERALKIARMFRARRAIFHAGYYSSKSKGHDEKFTKGALNFFSGLRGPPEIAVENVREDINLMKVILSPGKKLCLDIGHANLYTNQAVPDWIREFGKRMTHAHLHNNDGTEDSHRISGYMDLISIAKMLKCDMSLEVFDPIHDIERLLPDILDAKKGQHNQSE
ncbi:MAG: sugar phosphate isomerase/epimerase [Candidatus Aenigmarchaeota archaeon]|nr:sugar phosphate isomerase/epimerase [Candidatus Aenigmarchaeota archaeon]